MISGFMRRRDLLVGSTALAAIAITSTPHAQETLIGDITLPLRREQLSSLLSEINRLLLGVATLRLNLILSRPASDMASVDFGTANGQFQERMAQVRDSRERILSELANLPDLLPALSEQLEQAVRQATTRHREAGVAGASALLRDMSENFWAFLLVLERTSANGGSAIANWLCSSFPFDILC
ncbi:hypothetical protein [Sinorhizobium fredii]|uniref:hypothetical protein n=1 Tax=Rhizobium fredii TaxID=380 RepID=UPI003511198E